MSRQKGSEFEVIKNGGDRVRDEFRGSGGRACWRTLVEFGGKGSQGFRRPYLWKIIHTNHLPGCAIRFLK